MASSYKQLGQQAPAATTEVTLYTVPASKAAVLSTISVCNRDSGSATFRIAVLPGGGTTANADYLYYDETVTGNSTFLITAGIAMATTDVIKVYASTANLTFHAYGDELDA